MTRPILTLAAVLGAAALPLAGCGDDEPGPGGARVVVLDEQTRTPVAGVKIVVMDGATNTPAADPAITGADGTAAFPGLPVGSYPVLAFGGYRHRFLGFHPPLLQVVNPPRMGGSGIVDPATPAAPEVGPLTFLARPAGRDSLPRYRGTVVDAATGAPLGGAFLGLRPDMRGYAALTEPADDVTGPDGVFSVSGIPLAPDPVSGNLDQVVPLRVVRHGYRPRLFFHDFPPGNQEIDVTGLTIALERAAAADSASLTGRLIRGAEPLAGATVALAFVEPAGKGAAGLTGWGAVSDAEGRFAITGLPGGRYRLYVGHAVGDGVVVPPVPPQVEIGPGARVEAGDVPALHEIEPGQPYMGALLDGPPAYLAWSPVPGAAAYEVWLDRGFLGRYTDPVAPLPDDPGILPGLHVWEVGAFAADETLLGFSQVRAWFRIREATE